MDHVQITDRNSLVFSSKVGRKKAVNLTRIEMREKCNALCWVPAEKITIIDGHGKDNIVQFLNVTTEEKQALKNHILSYLAAIGAITSNWKTFSDQKKELIPENLTIDLSLVLPLPVTLAKAQEQTEKQKPVEKNTDIDISTPVATTQATVPVLDQPVQKRRKRSIQQPGLAQKILNPTTLGFSALCMVGTFLITKHVYAPNN